ncbi:hypothetical protein N9H39_01970, partial [Gammaproteobacteria bacterium]|nr:hypothetical protein [Gammaproteobacteria bacterium]
HTASEGCLRIPFCASGSGQFAPHLPIVSDRVSRAAGSGVSQVAYRFVRRVFFVLAVSQHSRDLCRNVIVSELIASIRILGMFGVKKVK